MSNNNKTKAWETETAQQFARVLKELNNIEVLQDFLRDVMTEKEITEISARLQAAKMLKEGKKYTEIIDETKLSSRTIARISEWMKNGTGGYATAINILARKK